MNDIEKRQSERMDGFWKVFLIDKDSSEEIELGYIFDISDEGINLWVNRRFTLNDEAFTIRIYLPKELSVDNIDFDVQVKRKTGKLGPYIEMGCHFNNISVDQREILKQFKAYFEKQKNSLNS